MVGKKVDSFINQHGLDLRNKGVVVGVSGGPDSLGLLQYLWKKRETWNITIVAAHVNHMFRGKESYAEAKFVEDFCKIHHIPIEIKHIDVPAYIAASKKSPQVAARECRYDFFAVVMQNYQLPYLALGHHGDDQIETMLMRLTRGSTGKARAGMAFKRSFQNGEIIRPFLCLSKGEIEEYCRVNQLNPRIDPSNSKDVYSRNRFRKYVLPLLKRENPQVHNHFQRFSEELQADEDFLQELTIQKMNKVMKRNIGEIILNIKIFTTMPIPLQRRGIQLILNYLYENKPTSLSAIHIDQLLSLLKNSKPSFSLDFPNGLRIIRSYDQCYFRFKPPEKGSYRFEINGSGTVYLPGGSEITIERTKTALIEAGLNRLLVDMGELSFPFFIRTRKNGDRMSIKGMNGTKKIKDIFIDQKVPIHLRDEWPIVTDYEDRILWLPGIKHASIPVKDKSDSHYLLFTYIKQ